VDSLQASIEAAKASGDWNSTTAREAVQQTLAELDAGRLRVAEPDADGGWRVNAWIKHAILGYFRQAEMTTIEVGPYEYHDKLPLKHDYAAQGVRVVPPGTARYGAHLEPGVVLMPGYVNIGAYVGANTMVDTWATVGSCAQIGQGVHLAGGVGIGGVLEPAGARPVIIEDHAFVGSRSIVVEGAHIGEGAVLGANTVINATIPIIDVTGDQPVTYRGEVPPRSVVVPGTRPKSFPAGTYHLACALIIGTRSSTTDEKTSLTEALRHVDLPT
jgi:2,3,4,5-tetrahydropyridine-2,6-dicarboxylate N-succinyltransferase